MTRLRWKRPSFLLLTFQRQQIFGLKNVHVKNMRRSATGFVVIQNLNRSSTMWQITDNQNARKLSHRWKMAKLMIKTSVKQEGSVYCAGYIQMTWSKCLLSRYWMPIFFPSFILAHVFFLWQSAHERLLLMDSMSATCTTTTEQWPNHGQRVTSDYNIAPPPGVGPCGSHLLKLFSERIQCLTPNYIT